MRRSSIEYDQVPLREASSRRLLKTLFVVFATVVVLQIAWPNLVHEPAHVVALRLQGSDGFVSFDWSLPATPTTTRTSPLAGLAGGFMFLLLPSIVQVMLVGVLWRNRGLVSFVAVHYLLFDLYLNVRGYANPISDFRFLQLVPWLAYVLMFGTFVVLVAYNVVRIRKLKGVVE